MQNYMSEKHVTIPTYSRSPLGILFKQNILSSSANGRLLSHAEVVKVCVFTQHLYQGCLLCKVSTFTYHIPQHFLLFPDLCSNFILLYP